ncbi:MAG: hypothetical protein SGI91_12930 [Alphaproteobacteria bacterium]|nr:hypothetical protein [Alphaproteobacteria bacterium]
MHRLAAPLLALLLFACSQAGPATPPEGSAEREAIFAALSVGRDQSELTYVTSHFLVQGDWAWVTAAPQSKDGTQRYESESWLLRKTPQGWQVVARPCVEEGCDPAQELAKIRQANPEAPAGIFPAG